MNKWNVDTNNIDFLEEGIEAIEETKGFYKVMIADDEEEVHKVTKVLLRDFKFEGKGLEFIDTYSAKETMEVLKEVDQIAVIFLDVVMEKNQSGLEVVDFIRNDLDNYMTRIVLRTGQPGEAPEETIIEKYDINDYRLKTELTVKRLFTTLFAAIRGYRDLVKLKKHQEGLEKIIKASAQLFKNNTLDDFLVSILEELTSFYDEDSKVLYVREEKVQNGLITRRDSELSRIVAATGEYKKYMGMCLEEIPEMSHIHKHLSSSSDGNNTLLRNVGKGLLIFSQHEDLTSNYIYVEGDSDLLNYDLINLFLSNFSVALDNFILSNMLKETQREIVFALAETVESHFEETGQHVKRISNMMYNFAILHDFSYQEAEVLRLASTMHDLGKVAIPDSILKKPARLTVEEFEIIKTHTNHGFKILNGSDLPVLKQAAEIALNHHEKFDGTGYPTGKTGRNIPLTSRMMAIVDVFDAMSYKRVYKDALPREEVLIILEEGKGSHFDPNLLEMFLNNLDEILSNIDQ